jgi:hypothetical protein
VASEDDVGHLKLKMFHENPQFSMVGHSVTSTRHEMARCLRISGQLDAQVSALTAVFQTQKSKSWSFHVQLTHAAPRREVVPALLPSDRAHVIKSQRSRQNRNQYRVGSKD